MILEMFLHPSWTPPVVNSTGHDFKRHTPVCARSHSWSYQHEVRRASNKNPVGHLWRDLKSFLMYLAAFTFFFCVCVCLLLHYCRELTIVWVISVTWMEVWSCLGRYLKAAVSVLVEWLIHSRSHLSDDSQDRSIFSNSVDHLQDVDTNTGRKHRFPISEAVWLRSDMTIPQKPKICPFSFLICHSRLSPECQGWFLI